jgi:hypothetical protein
MSLRKLANWNDSRSLMNRMRSRRMAVFENLIADLPRPLRIIDIGGTVQFWERRGWEARDDVVITVVNLEAEPSPHGNISSLSGDARDLREFADQSFDIAFSNSVIEHVGDFEQKRRMAAEVCRLAPNYWVQTPNYWFPIEPHFLFPGWQWLPEGLRVQLLRRRAFGWNGRCPDASKAREVVRHAQLASRRDLRRLFPAAALLPERFGGLVKSWIAVGGFETIPARSA